MTFPRRPLGWIPRSLRNRVRTSYHENCQREPHPSGVSSFSRCKHASGSSHCPVSRLIVYHTGPILCLSHYHYSTILHKTLLLLSMSHFLFLSYPMIPYRIPTSQSRSCAIITRRNLGRAVKLISGRVPVASTFCIPFPNHNSPANPRSPLRISYSPDL